jgi:hypothetical protein
VRNLKARFARLRADAADAGMTTAEYACGIIAAVGFAMLLHKVLTSNKVQAQLAALVERALNS